MPWYDLIKDPGLGNLNLRAYIASLVGPLRVAHGQRRVHQLQVNQSTLIAGNAGKGLQAMYVEAWIPTQILSAGGLRLLFSSSEGTGETGDLVTLGPFFNSQALDRYKAVLLVNEQLYAQAISDATGGALGERTPLVVSTVTF